MGFFAVAEDSRYIVTHLLYQAALLLALLRWVSSWAINRVHYNSDRLQQPPSVPFPHQIRDSLALTTYGDAAERMRGSCSDTCAVCLTQLNGDDQIRELRNCRHVFHKECIDRWVDHDHDHDHDQDNHNTCPLCRTPLLTTEQCSVWTRTEPSWAVERILYLFGDDLLM